MELLDHQVLKHSFTTRAIPPDRMVGLTSLVSPPQIGDLLVAEVLNIGKNTTVENQQGVALHLFPGDRIVGAFGNRYATDQYEGYVPAQPVDECALLSMGGVCGELASKHSAVAGPTRLRVLGAVCDGGGQPLNQRNFALPPRLPKADCGQVVVVVGASMNAGKTTTVGTLVRGLSAGGGRVAATKITGTAASKDLRFFEACGARPVLDFTAAGYPSTYLLSYDELMQIYTTLLGHLQDAEPDYIVIEIADGIFQRETRMLLESAEFRQTIDHLFFAASGSLSAESGGRYLEKYSLPLRAITGTITQSPLAMREATAVTGVSCLTIEQIVNGGVFTVLESNRWKASSFAWQSELDTTFVGKPHPQLQPA
jgi:hypothetical protein